MNWLLVVLAALLTIQCALCNTEQCSKPFEKSAVTEEAAEEAKRFKENPPVFSNEVYSSKVKSNNKNKPFYPKPF